MGPTWSPHVSPHVAHLPTYAHISHFDPIWVPYGRAGWDPTSDLCSGGGFDFDMGGGGKAPRAKLNFEEHGGVKLTEFECYSYVIECTMQILTYYVKFLASLAPRIHNYINRVVPRR